MLEFCDGVPAGHRKRKGLDALRTHSKPREDTSAYHRWMSEKKSSRERSIRRMGPKRMAAVVTRQDVCQYHSGSKMCSMNPPIVRRSSRRRHGAVREKRVYQLPILQLTKFHSCIRIAPGQHTADNSVSMHVPSRSCQFCRKTEKYLVPYIRRTSATSSIFLQNVFRSTTATSLTESTITTKYLSYLTYVRNRSPVVPWRWLGVVSEAVCDGMRPAGNVVSFGLIVCCEQHVPHSRNYLLQFVCGNVG